MKIGIPKDYFGEGLDEEVKKPILKSRRGSGKMQELRLKNLILRLVKYAIPAYYVIASAEASSTCPDLTV